MTRVQRERFFNEEDYLRLKDSYILEPKKLKNAKVAVFGLGGVGSYVCEGLARGGIGNFILVDFDKVDEMEMTFYQGVSAIHRSLVAEGKTYASARNVQKDFEKYKNRDLINSLSELLPQKMIEPFVSVTGIPPHTKVNSITKEQRKRIAICLKSFAVPISGFRSLDEAVITRGGVSVKEISPKTMESKICEGLYFAGEIIDVDGYTGGYNLQIAWSTARAAGLAAAGC